MQIATQNLRSVFGCLVYLGMLVSFARRIGDPLTTLPTGGALTYPYIRKMQQHATLHISTGILPGRVPRPLFGIRGTQWCNVICPTIVFGIHSEVPEAGSYGPAQSPPGRHRGHRKNDPRTGRTRSGSPANGRVRCRAVDCPRSRAPLPG